LTAAIDTEAQLGSADGVTDDWTAAEVITGAVALLAYAENRSAP
jgi:hypothetical protein